MAGAGRSEGSASRGPSGSLTRRCQAFNFASFYIGPVAAGELAAEWRDDVARDVNVVRRLAEVELRLAEEPAPVTDKLENPPRLDALAGERRCSSLPVSEVPARGCDGAFRPGRSVPALAATSLAVATAATAAAAPSPAATARSSAAIPGIIRLSGAVLLILLVAARALPIGWWGCGGAPHIPRVHASAFLLRSIRSGTG